MKKFKKTKLCIIPILMMSIIMYTSVINASAHSLFYDGNIGINVKWYDVTNRTAHLKMNGDMLNSDYAPHYSVVRNVWPNASDRVAVTNADFSVSNVDLCTATTTYWFNRWGSIKQGKVTGVCDNVSTDGYELLDKYNAQVSSRLIAYAGIKYTPYDVFYSDNQIRHTMVHEIGHALGLGHSDDGPYATDVPSVMIQDKLDYYIPTAHDLGDLNGMYNSSL